ncbi:CAP domain-containing protein [Endozoicomonas numazuensis]|uniref:CAP domain-containing protein n=1 Tax=Endozoicomonas numazuensis TaxID=1137799 RepID=UPI0006916B8F|nr:CAP domain-containing protein [Endozoicomonas numazuensis]
MNHPFIHRTIYLLISALTLSIATGLSHAATVDVFPMTHPDELNEYLSSHSYKTPESCTKSADQGSCWARSIMKVLSDKELIEIYRQVRQHLEYYDNDQINPAALHIYMESHTVGPSLGVPINNLNIQLAILLKKKILTVTLLPDGRIATQTFTGFEGGSYEVEENIISLAEEPETLFSALLTADISLLLTPGEGDTPGHVQPIIFDFQPRQAPEEVSVKSLLNSIVNSPVRVLDIFAASSGDIPSYFFSALRFGASNDNESLTQLRRDRKKREETTAKAKLQQEEEKRREEAARKYHEGDTARFCKNCAKIVAKLGAIGVTAAATYQKWETVKGYLQSFWNGVIVPRMPLIARLGGMGEGKAGDIPPELASYIDTLPQKGHVAWKYIYSKADNYVKSLGPKTQPTQGFAHAMLTAVNAIRSRPQTCGSTPMPAVVALKWNHSLEAAAKRHSLDMANKDFMDHKGSDNSQPDERIEAQGYIWKSYGENVAAGYSTVDEVLKGWMSSPGHCKNIMNPHVTEMGASFVEKAFSQYEIYWTQVFASPRF